eukprot:TRINITY_DN31054_c0_g1_i1.p1 TRINITY_DN31054_c0_g1~~TRINITY_DN31054_c0_g1_i1.p1  ORF type:complete len:300 (-),score=65.75 TRINITY_DN31054_c0_g1_i1:253-1152(-)
MSCALQFVAQSLAKRGQWRPAAARHFSAAPPAADLARPWIHVYKPFEPHAPWWTTEQRDVASHVFRSTICAHPVLVVQTLHRLPDMGLPQICFVGQSNVGKSSLINSLVFGKEIARPSHFAGRTRHLFVFDLGKQLSLADLPGYGYARVTRELRSDWYKLMEGYMEVAPRLQRVVCLVDASVGVSREDLRFWEAVQQARRQLMVVLTKVDKCHRKDLHKSVTSVLAYLQQLDKDYVWPYVHAVSAEHDMGMTELRASLAMESRASVKVARKAPTTTTSTFEASSLGRGSGSSRNVRRIT